MSDRPDVRSALLAVGVTADEIAEADADGTLELLALERLIDDHVPRYDLAELAQRSGMTEEQVRTFRRALGFPESAEHERLFDDDDLAMLEGTLALLQQGSIEPEIALQITRVIGSSIERIATAHVDAISIRRDDEGDDEGVDEAGDVVPAPPRRPDPSDEFEAYAGLLAMMPSVLDYVWRRHLIEAARRRRLRSRAGSGRSICVGFADMVGFTSTVRELPERDLAGVVSRFETTAYDVVQTGGGRVVKMIGDEVMFLADDVAIGAEIALALAERFRGDEALTDVRVGLATGPVLEKDGDVYGHVVNLASRIVSVAYPGSVVVSAGVHELLADDDRYTFRELRASYLKDIGREKLWALRHAGDETEDRYRRARDRRAARREVLRERLRSARTRDRGAAESERPADPTTDELEVVAEREAELLEVNEETVIATLRQELDDPRTEELQALTSVLSEDLAQIVETRDAKVSKVDEEFERRLDEVEEEARRRVDEIESEVERSVRDAERRVEEARREAQRKIQEAEEEVQRAQREAARRIDEAERIALEKAQRASEDAERRRQKLAREAGKRAQKAGREALRRLSRESRRGHRGGGGPGPVSGFGQ